MTDVSVSECVSMVHPAPDDGARPSENPTGPVDDLDGVAVPTATPATNDKVESSSTSKGPSRQQKSVSDGRPVRETQSRPKDHRIHRYSPLGVPKPGQTARVQRMVERAQREFEKTQQQSPPYHSKHAPSIPTPEAYKSVQMGYQNMERMVRDEYPEHLPVNYLADLNIGPTRALPPPMISLTPAE